MGMPGRRPSYHRGKWQLQRERLQLPEGTPPTPDRDPRRLAEGIEVLVRSLLPRADQDLRALANEWATIVGADLARHTRPASLERGCLTVYVDSSPWLSELQRFAQTRILEAVRARFGDNAAKVLRLRLDPDAGRAPRQA